MKKTIFILALVGVLGACGGGDKKDNTTKEDSAPKTEDLSDNPDYQKGLETLNRVTICGTCHKIDEKNIGPAWKDVAAKYAGQDTALNYLVNKIQNGGVGVWGEVPMPANNAISKEDITALAKYILVLKK